MREIKFRAWHKGRMVDMDELCSVIMGDYSALILDILGGDEPEASLMQFTGLKDKNGKEIYEGDVLVGDCYPFYGDAVGDNAKLPGEYAELNYVGEVGIDADGAFYELSVVSDRVAGGAYGGALSEIVSRCRVIGNIHENPELLDTV